MWSSTNLRASSMEVMTSLVGVSHPQPSPAQGQGLLATGAILVRGRGVRRAGLQVRNDPLPGLVQDF